MATAQTWPELLPSPYDICMEGWSRVHWVDLHDYDVADKMMYNVFKELWREMESSGKKEFLERNGISPENTRIASVHHKVAKKVRLCIMAPLPQEVKSLFHLTFDEPESQWRL